jgi:hypothetical protein
MRGTALRNVRVPGPGTSFSFRPNDSFMGMNLAQELDKECPAQSQAPAQAATRVGLSKLTDAKGDIDVQQLTCGRRHRLLQSQQGQACDKGDRFGAEGGRGGRASFFAGVSFDNGLDTEEPTFGGPGRMLV